MPSAFWGSAMLKIWSVLAAPSLLTSLAFASEMQAFECLAAKELGMADLKQKVPTDLSLDN
jgi:hypothetical protein